ncbi:MAG: right-handed parallel beta-helix repeat-containing protein [Niabella sp.]|nr:right-handed parallel beta-helix repeat-containing protein [Niabella sp.]
MRRQRTINETIYVVIGDGKYFMTEPLLLSTEDGGTADAPVIFMAAKNAHPVFYGGVQLKGFQKVNDHLWQASIQSQVGGDMHFDQLYVNNRAATPARAPNKDLLNIEKIETTYLDSSKTKAEYTIYPDAAGNAILKQLSNALQKNASVYFFLKWNTLIAPIIKINDDYKSFVIESRTLPDYNSFDKKTRFFFAFNNAVLDTANEWDLDNKGILSYQPAIGETPDNTNFYLPTIKQFIIAKGDDDAHKIGHIYFKNLAFAVSASDNLLKGYYPKQAASGIEAVVTLDFAKNVSFYNCTIAQTGQYAFWLRKNCEDCHIVHCYLHDLGAGGIKIGEPDLQKDNTDLTHNITVDNNIITHGGLVYPEAVGVLVFNSPANTISHNEISDFVYTGISVGWVWGYTFSPSINNKILYNHIHHLGWGALSDMAGVYTLGNSKGTIVSNNRIHDVYTYDYGGWGLYCDEGTSGIVMKNNLVYRCKSGGFHQHYGADNVITNNIFADNLEQQLQATRVEDHLSFTFTHNIVYFTTGKLFASNWNKVKIITDSNCYWHVKGENFLFGKDNFAAWKATGKDLHSIIADPGFENPAADDYKFKNLNAAKKIGFKIVSYPEAGVYGNTQWKKLSQLPQERIAAFNAIATKNSE